MSPRDGLLVLLGALLALSAFYAVLPWIVRPLFRALLSPRYGFRIVGLEHLPKSGPVVLAVNHVTWLDGFFLAASCPRRGKALVNGGYVNYPGVRQLARRVGLVPVPYSGPSAQRAMFATCRAALDRGEVVAIFPEGQLSRNGLTGTFQRGIEIVLKGREHVPVVPVFLDNLWGSLFSFSEGRFLSKRPRGWRRTIAVAFGPPVPSPVTTFRVRQAVLAAGVRAFEQRRAPVPPLETIDPDLPHLDHPALGPLTGSTADYQQGEVRQDGRKPGTVGQPLPGVALRVVDESGAERGPDEEGRVQALLAGRPEWVETGLIGSLDRDGFLRVVSPSTGPSPESTPDSGLDP